MSDLEWYLFVLAIGLFVALGTMPCALLIAGVEAGLHRIFYRGRHRA